MLIKISREIFRLEIWKSKFSNGTDLSTVGVAFSHFRVTDLFDHFFSFLFFFFARATIIRGRELIRLDVRVLEKAEKNNDDDQ